MSNAPKWIAEILEKLPGTVGPIEREALAIEIAENFPVRECMAAAAGSLRAQLRTASLAVIDDAADAMANNVLQAIGGAVMGADTDATHHYDEWIEVMTLLGNIGAPWKLGDKRLRPAERLNLLINTRRGGVVDSIEQRKIERCRAAISAALDAFHQGEITAIHEPLEGPEHDFEPYPSGAAHLAGLCCVCGCGDPHPMAGFRDCPEDEDCKCDGPAAINALGYALQAIEGKIEP